MSVTEYPRHLDPSPGWRWLFLAGPALWSLYFWMSGRAGLFGCEPDAWPLIVWSVLAVSGLVMVSLAWSATRSGNDSRGSHPAVMRDGLLLGIGMLVSALVVGVPALVSHPC